MCAAQSADESATRCDSHAPSDASAPTNAGNLGLVSPSDVVRVALAGFVLKRYVGREVRSMAVAPVPGHAPISEDPAHANSRLARWAVGLAGAVVVAIAASFAIFAVAYAIGGSGATEDNWVGFLGMVSLLGGLLASLAAFALAVVARVKHERWTLLWLPLSLFPALLAFLLLGEAFWWE